MEEEEDESSCDELIYFSLGVDRLSKTERGTIHLHAPNEATSALSAIVCLLDAPSYLIPSDLVKFFASMLPRIRRIQILRRFGTQDTYLALFYLTDSDAVDVFVAGYDGVVFSSLESSLCTLRRVKGVEQPCAMSRDGAEEEMAFCPVCLEPLCLEALFTGCCGHTLHAACATRLESSLCPVCRFQHDDPDNVFSACGVCGWRGNDTDIWVCLVCGAVACGSENADHIRCHYRETLHTYAVNTATGAVFDFAGEGFVHRLALQRSDAQSEPSNVAIVSKIAEVADPRMEDWRTSQSSKMCRSAVPQGRSEWEERVVNALLERAAYSFSSEMARRLERHRLQLETRLQRHRTFIAHEAQVNCKRRSNHLIMLADRAVAALGGRQRFGSSCSTTAASSRTRL